MKIAINTRFLLADGLEGIGVFTQELASRLVKRYPEVEFYFLFDREFDQRYIYGKNVKGIKVSPPARHPFLWYLWFEQAIPRVLKKHQIDLFLSLDGYCSLKSKVPTLMLIHDLAYLHYPEQVPLLVRKFYQRFVPRYCHRADQLLTISKASQKDIASNFSIPAEAIGIVPNGYNPNFSPLSNNEKTDAREKYAEGQNYFCSLGAIHPRKNIEGTLRAFEAYKKESKSKDKLLIIGRMAWKSGEVLSIAKNAACSSDIHFLGFIPDEAVHQILGAAKALLFLSLFEGFGRPLLESMQLAIPSIYSNVSVMPEVAGATGVAVDPLNINEIVAAMINIEAFDLARLQDLRTQKLQEYSWDRAADILGGFIDKMMLPA